MVDHFQIATQGVGPGFSTFNFATQGFGFEVEVIVQPSFGGGGGAGKTVWHDANDYEIIVRIKYKGQTWEQKRRISQLMAKSIEKVLATFRRTKISTVEIMAKLNTIIKQDIRVIWKKR